LASSRNNSSEKVFSPTSVPYYRSFWRVNVVAVAAYRHQYPFVFVSDDLARFVGNRQMHSAITSTTTNPKQLNHAKIIRESPVQAV
jgi:hypothetical protein